MREAHRYVGYALLTFLDRARLNDAFVAPKPHSLWNRDSGQAMNASGPPATANGTSLYPDSHFNVSEECILWDNTCQGDKQKAASVFFNKTLQALLENECFSVTNSAHDVVVGLNEEVDESPAGYDPGQCPGGTAGIPPATSSLWSTLKSWMREPACASSSLEYGSAVREPSAQAVMYGCCVPCSIDCPNVYVYYWPSPEANTSCLSFVGTSVNAPTQGATTGGGYTYWGYTPTDANRYTPIITTMVYTEINGIWFKMPMSNPWESKPGASVSTDPGMWNMPSTTLPSWSTPEIQRRAESLDQTIQARANPIAITNLRRAPINESNGISVNNDASPGSTVIYGSHTFTSPSIYVDFYSLSATDRCGYRGPTIDSTLLAFTPGELSTVATAMYAARQKGITTGSVYNFNDLPCPPMSVMSSQWYKPEPGEPFRPLIVFPSKLLDIHPLWKICIPGSFTGYDPPKTLDLATALVPKVTPPSALNLDPGTPKPAATQESLPRRTSTSADPTNTISDPSLAKSHGSSGVQDDVYQKNSPPKDTKIVSVDPSTNNQGSSDSQRQSLQASPASSHPKDGSVEHTLSNAAANSDPTQQSDNVHANNEAPTRDGDTTYEPQPLASSSASSVTAILEDHVLASVKDSHMNSINIDSGASATGASGQQIATSNNLRTNDQLAYINPVASFSITRIANHILTPLPQGVAIQETTLKNGAPAAIIASTTFSLDGFNNIFINAHSYPIPKPTLKPTAINNEAVLPLPTGISIHSTALMPGAPALIIDATSYSLDTSSNLHYGHKIEAASKPIVTDARIAAIADPLLSSNLGVGALTIPLQTSGLISGGLVSPGSENRTGSGMSGSIGSALAFTGGAEGRRPGFSCTLLLLVLIGAWSYIGV